MADGAASKRLLLNRVMGLVRGLRRLRRDMRGSTIAMMAAALIPVIAALGAGIDMGRLYLVKSQLQAGVDAGALAGARAFEVKDGSPVSRTEQAESYFYGNFPTGYMGSDQLALTPTFAVNDDGINVTTLVAQANVPMTFMRIFGQNPRTITAVAKAELQPRPLEAMVVLDDTGSMRFNLDGGRTRMAALKEAAHGFVDVLFQGNDQRRDLGLGFLAYDTTVNVGHLLENAHISLNDDGVKELDGFNSGVIKYGGDWPSNRLAWKGCVMADSTVRNVNNDRNYSEPGAWDLTRTLPGEGGNPAVDPYFVPPVWVPKDRNPSAADLANPDSKYYRPYSSEPSDNLYRLDRTSYGAVGAYYLANSEAYKKYFYRYYIGLNDDKSSAYNDVIVKKNGKYLKPTPGKINSNDWVVNFQRIPQLDSRWHDPETARVNPAGGSVDSYNKNQTPNFSPNWQCPEEARQVKYGRSKSFYTDVIDNENGAIYPGNGTLHHSGLLWGYRLLVRDDAFPRSNPTNEKPRRALIFMTDGENQVAERQNGYLDRTYTWYGQWVDADGNNSRVASNQSQTEEQSVRRFAKTCANIQKEDNPPEIYIIALVTNDYKTNKMFNDCAPGHVYHTNSTSELRKAFQDVASELVDLHLVQ